MRILLFILAIAIGHVFAFIDSRPNFDDTGVLAFSIAITCAILAFISPRRPWLWGLAVGVWIPLHNLIHHGNPASLLALAFALAGAYVGAGLQRILLRHDRSAS
jgi:uncharacterized membrane protein AbrB (regulator of aidB expression)